MKLIILTIVAAVAFVCYELYCRKVRPGPMYPKFKKELDARRRDKTIPLPHAFICPWCRTRCFRSTERESWTSEPSRSIFCDDCQKEIRKIILTDGRPDFVDEHDWLYFERGRTDDSFWVIYRDYQLGDIEKSEATKLIHNLVPKDFGKIKPPKYRNNTVYQWHDVNSHSTTCTICGEFTHMCTCSKTYRSELMHGKYPREFEENLAKLRELNPMSVLLSYYRQGGRILACMQDRSGFSPLDFISLND